MVLWTPWDAAQQREDYSRTNIVDVMAVFRDVAVDVPLAHLSEASDHAADHDCAPAHCDLPPFR
jgi:hypothetical protein